MKRLIGCIILGFFSCAKEVVPVSEVLSPMQFSSRTIVADGSSTISITVEIGKDADADKRNMRFSTSSGNFVGGDTTLVKKAEFEGGKLIARVQLKAPMKPGIIKISVKPEASNQFTDYTVSDEIVAVRSEPSQIRVSASSFSVLTAYAGEIRVKGILLNKSDKYVSVGYKVAFEDFFQNGNRVNGRFREVQNISMDSSSVSALYSPGYIPSGSTIYIKATILDSLGVKTSMADSVIINTL